MFDETSICQIRVNEDSTSALSEAGEVYTWGLGARGRLGLKDTVDRLYPCKVSFTGAHKEEESKKSHHHNKQSKKIDQEFEQEYERIAEAKKKVRKMGNIDEMIDMFNFVNNASKRHDPTVYMTEKIRRYSKESLSDDSDGEMIVSELVPNTHSGSKTLSKAVLDQNVLLSNLDTVIVTNISCSSKHTLITTNTGAVYGWGSNDFHQLGYENKDTKKPFTDNPRKIFGALSKTFIVKVECGDNHSLALSNDKQLYGWGSNLKCQLGLN